LADEVYTVNCEIVLDADAPDELWLAERRKGLTSSDAAPIAGMSPWRTALDVFLDKRGMLPEKRVSGPMRWGTRLEPVIAAAYTELTGRALSIPPRLVRSPSTPWLLASLDRVTNDGRIVEIKTTRTAEGWGESGTDEVPDWYLLQVSHQLLTTGADAAEVAVLIGGSDFRRYTIGRPKALLDSLLRSEETFWARHQANDPPEPDWSHPHTPELLARTRGFEPGPPALLGGEVFELWQRWQELGEQVKAGRIADDERKTLKAKIEHAMGTADCGVFADGSEIFRALRRNRGYEVQPFDYTVLTSNPPKGK
jgi:putative phage-type endonuclease